MKEIRNAHDVAVSIAQGDTQKPAGWENVPAQRIANAIAGGDLRYDKQTNAVTETGTTRGPQHYS